jgi:hypothetical protein
MLLHRRRHQHEPADRSANPALHDLPLRGYEMSMLSGTDLAWA